MKSLIKKLFFSLTLAVAATSTAMAQYPNNTIKLVVPFGAGGITDLVARHLAEEFSKQIGETVIIDNKPGAGGAVGAQVAASARPDGYTLFMGTVGTQIVNDLIMEKLHYAPDDFIPIGLVSGSPYVLAVSKELNIDSIDDLVALAKKDPDALAFGSAGIGSSPQLGIELLKFNEGVEILHVPVKRGGEAVTAAASGQVDMVMDAIPVVMPQVTSGNLVALGLACERRSNAAPDLATTAEHGYEDLRISSWNAIYAPKDTPDEVVEILRDTLQRTLQSEDLIKALKGQGSDVYTWTMEEYDTFIQEETQKWQTIVTEAGITVD